VLLLQLFQIVNIFTVNLIITCDKIIFTNFDGGSRVWEEMWRYVSCCCRNMRWGEVYGSDLEITDGRTRGSAPTLLTEYGAEFEVSQAFMRVSTGIMQRSA